jgi:hypothetical protein
VPSTVPTVKPGLRNWLRTRTGLTPADGVTVRGRAINPGEETNAMVILTRVIAPQAFAVMAATKEETPTLTGYVLAKKPGTGDDAEDAARNRAYELFGFIETALRTDPTAGGVVAGPGMAEVTEGDLEEGPGDEEGSGTCKAQVRFLIRWQSDF